MNKTDKKIRNRIEQLENRLLDIFDTTLERKLTLYEEANYREEIKKLLAQIEILEDIFNE